MTSDGEGTTRFRPAVLVALGMSVLVAGGVGAFLALRTPPSPPPAEIAGDPLLVDGRERFLERCVGCHGTSGRGDGPLARQFTNPPVGDLTDATWKHGDQPAQVLKVIVSGVDGTAMPGWKGVFGPEGLRAVTAYVYHLAGRPVPAELRGPVTR